ncbi:MAG: ribonuclease P protein component [Acidimicrobiales bacterium]
MRRGPITVIFLYSKDEVRPRVAYALGRRVGGAVQRNRLRRRLRALITELGPGMVPGAYLIGADPAAKDMSFQDLRTLLRQATESASRTGPA